VGVTLTLPTPGDIGTSGVWGTTLNTAINALNADTFKLKTADATGVISNTTVADDTGASPLTGITLGVGTWDISCVFFATGNAAGDIKIAWAFSGTTTSAYRGGQGPSAGATSVLTGATAGDRNAGASDTGTTITAGAIYATDGTNTTMILERGVLVVTVSGTFKIQWAQGTSNGAATTLKAGSYVKATQVA